MDPKLLSNYRPARSAVPVFTKTGPVPKVRSLLIGTIRDVAAAAIIFGMGYLAMLTFFTFAG